MKINEMKINAKLLSYKDLSARWQIPVQTLRIWVMEKKLKPLKLCRHVRFKLNYIQKLEEEGLKES